MPFNAYKSIGTVLKQFQIQYVEAVYIVETELLVSDYFRNELELSMSEGVVDNSEYAICENLIYPVLREVWKSYLDKFVIWSHQSIFYDANLSGIPDYILAQRSPLGKVVFDKPYLVTVEAKRESNFDEGWGQCLAEMITAQRLNNEPEKTVFGIVSNGEVWQFGKLLGYNFTKNTIFYTIQELDKLFAAVNYVFKQCELQLE